MLMKNALRLAAATVAFASILTGCGSPENTRIAALEAEGADLTEEERMKTDVITPEQEAQINVEEDLFDPNDPPLESPAPPKPGEWTVIQEWGPVTFEQGVAFMDVIVAGTLENVSGIVWNSPNGRAWTPDPSDAASTTPESWQVLTVRVGEIVESNRDLALGDVVDIAYLNTTPGFELVPADFKGSPILLGVYQREVTYSDKSVAAILVADPQITYLAIPKEREAMVRLYSAACDVNWSDILERGIADPRVGEAEWVTSLDTLIARAQQPGPVTGQLGYADLQSCGDNEQPTDPEAEKIVP